MMIYDDICNKHKYRYKYKRKQADINLYRNIAVEVREEKVFDGFIQWLTID